MKLRTKLVLAIVSIVVVAGASLFTGAYAVLTHSFTHVEKEEVYLDIERVNRAIESRLNSLGATVNDWSVWDETYDFVAQPNRQYIEDNLSDSVFEYMHINLIAIIDHDGNLVAGKTYDLTNHQEIPFASDVRSA